MSLYPQRIVCMTEESCEILYLLGEQRRIVGISGFTVRPPQARREKPKVSAFVDADVEKIVALRPDLAIGFSDIQAPVAQQLISRGIAVTIFNQRSLAEIFQVIAVIGAMVGQGRRALALARDLRRNLREVHRSNQKRPARPRVFFEEWPEPLICGIRWVSELVEVAGGSDIFRERRRCGLGRERIVEGAEVVRRNPQIIVASWCGKKVRPEQIAARPGWGATEAVQNGRIHPVKSAIILQPGPAALTDGLRALQAIIG